MTLAFRLVAAVLLLATAAGCNAQVAPRPTVTVTVTAPIYPIQL